MKLQNLVHILIGIVCIGLLPKTQAVSPPPDGGYPGGNTAEGASALLSLTSGTYNTAVGFLSLKSDGAGNFNTAVGAGTLLVNTADNNTATGAAALLSNSTGIQNTANGAFALFTNNTGTNNTATGYLTLTHNTEGVGNTANGIQALLNNLTGNANTAIGDSALGNNIAGNLNTALGANALLNSTTGSLNIAIGVNAGEGVLGASNVIAIGAAGADVSNSCFIGNISGVNEGGTISAVYINSNGQLGTQAPPSARRFKKAIKSLEQTSEAILALKPVTFQYKSDTTRTPQFGLIAEEVAAVNPDLVVRDKSGEIYTVRYDAVNAMLLNEFLKEHRKVEAQGRKIEEQETTIADLKKDFRTTVARQQKEFGSKIARQQEQIDALSAGLQGVSEKLVGEKSTSQVVLNNP